MPDERVKVVYISGFWRSGTTLLARALGELPEVFDAGELRLIWQYSFLNDGVCSCELPFSSCALWQEIVREAFGSHAPPDPLDMIQHQPTSYHSPLMVAPGTTSLLTKRFAPYLEVLDRLYPAIARVSKSNIIVDASKMPQYGYLLRLVPSIQVYVVHLVRDPRGVEYSVLRRKRMGNPNVPPASITTLSRRWTMFNLIQELFAFRDRRSYLRLRYEDFVTQPAEALNRITTFLGEPARGLPQIADGSISLGVNHAISGSDGRFRSGNIPLVLDTRWRAEMDARERSLATLLMSPMLHHYRYAR